MLGDADCDHVRPRSLQRPDLVLDELPWISQLESDVDLTAVSGCDESILQVVDQKRAWSLVLRGSIAGI